ncbi:hypothetical protein PENSUB_4284 [Penicillium subrubescens]|uniref:F-box domain-containing protein n=1 Tax=Penicillium subrubescens TaxID=1316194 RepID=A0A1Q5UCR8_9EURO|nr:hypothetical protein PENSUB_4284 [Penicillium subrubescens]
MECISAEIMSMIMENLDLQSLISLCLVSKCFRDFARPLVFKTVKVSSSHPDIRKRLGLLWEAISSSSPLTKLIKTFMLNEWGLDHALYEKVSHFAHRLKPILPMTALNLRYLCLPIDKFTLLSLQGLQFPNLHEFWGEEHPDFRSDGDELFKLRPFKFAPSISALHLKGFRSAGAIELSKIEVAASGVRE